MKAISDIAFIGRIAFTPVAFITGKFCWAKLAGGKQKVKAGKKGESKTKNAFTLKYL